MWVFERLQAAEPKTRMVVAACAGSKLSQQGALKESERESLNKSEQAARRVRKDGTCRRVNMAVCLFFRKFEKIDKEHQDSEQPMIGFRMLTEHLRQSPETHQVCDRREKRLSPIKLTSPVDPQNGSVPGDRRTQLWINCRGCAEYVHSKVHTTWVAD